MFNSYIPLQYTNNLFIIVYSRFIYRVFGNCEITESHLIVLQRKLYACTNNNINRIPSNFKPNININISINVSIISNKKHKKTKQIVVHIYTISLFLCTMYKILIVFSL